MENENLPAPEMNQPSASAPVPQPEQPAQAVSSEPVPVAAEPSPETPTKHHGMSKWIFIAAGVLLLAGVASGLYFSGILNPPQQPLNGAAQESATASEQSFAASEQSNTTSSEQTQAFALTQQPLTACPVGQVMDPTSNTCACDINNNYFAIPSNLIAGTEQANACTTCGELSNEILALGQSGSPTDVARLALLQSLAQAQNCSPCSSYDDNIAQASQSGAWDKYFSLVVQKSQDNTCGQHLSECDSLRWQMLTMNDLLTRLSKDPTSDPAMIQTLKGTQQSLAEDLGNNPACYSMQNLCTQLQAIYNPSPVLALPKRTRIIGTPLLSMGSSLAKGNTQMMTQQAMISSEQFSSMQLSSSQESTQQVDYGSMSPDKFFDKQFYLLHCPVGLTQQSVTQEQTQQQTQQQTQPAPSTVAPPAAPASTTSAPRGVRRVARNATQAST